ncbi:hypothetical protein [Cupriavidus sp. BIC8F]|uniref:hypothetical protein n=1 Tax=Cupriavidus sp. BIC8F TaxID=3079014 RepID=UPI002916102A|nr:hypothetical protein [Cupriavidus sp. BIC8F]
MDYQPNNTYQVSAGGHYLTVNAKSETKIVPSSDIRAIRVAHAAGVKDHWWEVVIDTSLPKPTVVKAFGEHERDEADNDAAYLASRLFAK